MYPKRADYAVITAHRFAFGMLLMLFSLGACDDNENLDWRPQIASPLAFGDLGINDQPDLRDIDFSLRLGFDLGVGGIFAPVPVFQDRQAGPESFQIDDPVFVEIGIEELAFEGTLLNQTPIDLEAGAVINVRNAGDTEVLVQHITTELIRAGNSYTFSESIAQGTIQPDLELSVEEISSPGSSTPVRVNPSNLLVNFSISLPRIVSIVYPPQTSSDFTIESAFDIGIGDDLDNLEGDLGLVLESTFPVGFSIQILFQDENGFVLSSFTETPITIEAGSEANPSSEVAVVSAPQVINSLRDAERIRIDGTFSTPNTGNVLVDTSNVVNFKLLANFIADIETN